MLQTYIGKGGWRRGVLENAVIPSTTNAIRIQLREAAVKISSLQAAKKIYIPFIKERKKSLDI